MGANIVQLCGSLLLTVSLCVAATATESMTSINACFARTDGTILQNPENCNSFLYCQKQHPIVMACGLHEAFSVKSLSCVRSSLSDCIASRQFAEGVCDNEIRAENKAACTDNPFGALVAYPGNCSRFLICNCEYPSVENCPGGLHFNAEREICDWPQNVNCNSGSAPPSSTPSPTSSPTPELLPCDVPSGLDPNECIGYMNGQLLRYPYNCNAYVNCTNQCPVLNYCPPDKVFNEFLLICDTPDTAQCIEEPTTPTTTTTTTTTAAPTTTTTTKATTTTTTTKATTTTTTTTKATTTTPATTTSTTTEATTSTTTKKPLPPDVEPTSCHNLPNGALLPYPGHCEQFLQCIDHEVIVQPCPAGLHFNPNLLICDDPNDAFCSTQTITTTASPATSTATPPTTTPHSDLCKDAPQGASFPYVQDCSQYYYCYGNGTSTILHCPNNNWYNPSTGNCGPNVSPTACQRPITTTTTAATSTIDPTNPCRNQADGTNYPNTANCQTYFHCQGGNSVELPCPYNNWFNPLTGNCGPDVSPTACQETVTTPVPTTPFPTTTAPNYEHGVCGAAQNGAKLPYPGNCRKYIVCQQPVPVAHYCDDNLWFNESTQLCVVPAQSNCNQTGTPLPETTTPVPTRPPPKGPCDGLEYGTLLPYPNNCSKYIVCELPINVGYDCPEGLEFNADKRECMSPEQANCSNKLTTSISPPLNACEHQPDATKLPYIADCGQYIVCLGGQEMVVPCMPNTYYNPAKGSCDRDIGHMACHQLLQLSVSYTTR